MVEMSGLTNLQIKRRRKIIEAGLDVLEKERALNLDRVIKLSGGSKGSIYQCFGNKQGFEAAIADEIYQRIDGIVEAMLHELVLLIEAEKLTRDQLRDGVYNILKVLNAKRGRKAIRLLLLQNPFDGLPIQKVYRDGTERFVSQISVLFELLSRGKGRERKILPTTGDMLFGLIFSPIILNHLLHAPPRGVRKAKLMEHADRTADFLMRVV